MATARKRPISNTKAADPTKWANAVFAVFGFLAAWMMVHLIEDVWSIAWSMQPTLRRPTSVWVNGIGIPLGFLLVVWAWRRPAWFQFIREVVEEVAQVRWPTRAETRSMTIIVVSISLTCACLAWGMDVFWGTVTDWLYGL
jgi:preprotein translocase subunit SecE